MSEFLKQALRRGYIMVVNGDPFKLRCSWCKTPRGKTGEFMLCVLCDHGQASK